MPTAHSRYRTSIPAIFANSSPALLGVEYARHLVDSAAISVRRHAPPAVFVQHMLSVYAVLVGKLHTKSAAMRLVDRACARILGVSPYLYRREKHVEFLRRVARRLDAPALRA
jgi:hypothetical protein